MSSDDAATRADDAGAPATADAYFVMTCEGVYPAAAVELESEWNGPPWMTGELIERDVPTPVAFARDPDYPGTLKPMYEGTILLMRRDLVEVLRDAGVDNLQLFPATVRDPATGETRDDYHAVNVVGLVSAADRDASELMDTDDDADMIDVDFASLVLDESRIGDLLLFRLAESVSAIVVHRRVRERVEAAVPGMTFYASNEWSG